MFTVALVPKLLDHRYAGGVPLPPPVAVLVTLEVAQVKFAEPLIPAVCTVLSCETVVVAVAVQPFVEVTVTV